jgi:uncharacterized Rmd1/YagE family protein
LYSEKKTDEKERKKETKVQKTDEKERKKETKVQKTDEKERKKETKVQMTARARRVLESSGFSLRAVFVGLGRESCENECVSERGSAHVMTLPSQHIEKIGGDQSAATYACLIMILRAELS